MFDSADEGSATIVTMARYRRCPSAADDNWAGVAPRGWIDNRP